MILHATPTTQENLTKLYIATLDRAPDSQGFEYWLNSGWEIEDIASSFFDQEETKEKYPKDFSNTDFIQAIYKNIFKRVADREGLEYWYNAIEEEKIKRSVFILAIVNGALGDDATILENKLTVALKFARSGREDTKEAKEIMIPITRDISTVNSTLCKHTLSKCYTLSEPKKDSLKITDSKLQEEDHATTPPSAVIESNSRDDKTKSLFVSSNTPSDTSATEGSINNPFQTISKAIEKAKELKDDKVNIFIRGGIYLVDKTITLKNINARTSNVPLIISAYNDENVTLLGAKKITNFRLVIYSDAAYTLLSNSAKAHVLVSDLTDLGLENLSEPIFYTPKEDWIYGNELFAGDTKVVFSHYPKDHMLNFLSDGSSHNYTQNHEDDNKTIVYSNNSDEDIDVINSWKDEINIYTYARWKYDWSDSRTKIDFMDTSKTTINLKNMPYYGYQKDSTNSSYKGLGFYAYNLASALDENSYYIDYTNKILYYYPQREDEKEKYISYLENIIMIENSSNITLSNINFSMSKQNAIKVIKSRDVNISNCSIMNIANRAIDFDDVNNSEISHCTISKIGGAGIRANGGDRDSLTAGNTIISNNNISKIAQIAKYYTAGVRIIGDGIQVRNNEIYDLPHIAIYFNGNNHIIEGNIIHDVVKNAHDAGAIYAGQDWSQRGTIIKNNFLYNIRGENNFGAAGIYLDDLFSGTVVKNNILYNVYRAILVGGGRDNIIDNNFIIKSRVALHTDARAMRWYDSDEKAKIHMGYILNKVPWQSELWQVAYPKLFTIYDDSPRLPLGNIISNNRVIETKYPTEYSNDTEQYLELRDNNFTEEGTYHLKNSNDFDTSKEFKEYLMGL